MGCFFEIVLEMLIEGILYVVMSVYQKIAHVLVPNQEISQKTKHKIRDVLTIISVFLTLILFLGVIFLLPGDSKINMVGRYMTFVPLSILGLQVILSVIIIVVRAVKHRED